MVVWEDWMEMEMQHLVPVGILLVSNLVFCPGLSTDAVVEDTELLHDQMEREREYERDLEQVGGRKIFGILLWTKK